MAATARPTSSAAPASYAAAATAPAHRAPERRQTTPHGALLRAVAPDERLPRRPRPVRQRRMIALISAGLVLTLGLLANVAIHVETTQGQFRLERLQSEATTKEVAYQKLRVEVARLEAPQRIVAEAKRIGMVEPPEVRYLAPNGATSAAGAGAEAREDAATGGAGSWAEVKSHLGAPR